VTNLSLRAFSALLLAAAIPALAQAQENPAIAAGLAIPGGPAAMERAAIPASGRYVVIDAASARLFMVENGEIIDSMRVIVGKPEAATPVLRSTLYYATLNPYWNVPTNLGRTLIAPNVLKHGISYLRERGYEVVSAFVEDPEILDPESIDWQAVADGEVIVHVRQRPGPANSMGQMKFGFDNNDGIFLHDTPKKELFAEAQRNLSNGCVRLEDAPRLARWLLGRDAVGSAEPEQHIALPRPVPIIITHFDGGPSRDLAAVR
jgi:murein L,D-transpeptidase YcbB/YkuD